MPSLAGETRRESDMWGVTPLDQLWCRITFKRARYAGALTPPGPTPSIMYPGYAGGMNWGSVTIDPSRRVLVPVSVRKTVVVGTSVSVRVNIGGRCIFIKKEKHSKINRRIDRPQ